MFRFRFPPLFAIIAALPLAASAGEKIDFDAGWRFVRADAPGSEKTGFDDARWSLLSAPHTYNGTDTFGDFATAGHEGERNQYGGKATYRKTFDAPAGWVGKKVFVEFEAVRRSPMCI